MTVRVRRAPPAGFEEISRDGAAVWVRPEAYAWVEATLTRFGTLYEGARFEAGREAASVGRAPVYVVRCASQPWAVRHSVRGGVPAHLLGDRYFRVWTPRPFREAFVSEQLRSTGIPTPRLIAAAVYGTKAFYQGDVVTEYLTEALDFGEFLFGERSPQQGRIPALEAAGALVRRLSSLGFRHPDLNAKNLLVESRDGPPRIHVLDLDRCRPGTRIPRLAAWRMWRRLQTSLRRWEVRSGRPLPPGEWAALARGLREGG